MSHATMQDQSPWRAPLSSKVGLIFVVTFFWTFLSHSSAQLQDITPPILTAFSFTPTPIDTSTGPVVVTVSWSATDDLSGVGFLVGVMDCNRNRPGLQSPRFPDHIICLYRPCQDHIICN
jgi:hypothetical protein